jgi:hypothetical protein
MGYTRSHKLNGFSDNSYSFPSNNVRSKETASVEEACSVVDDAETLRQPESSSSHSPDPGNQDTVCRGKLCQDDTFSVPKSYYRFHSSQRSKQRSCRSGKEKRTQRNMSEVGEI